jgi:N-methylhydantoinase A
MSLYRVGIDIGGTFTDFALQIDDNIKLHKTLSTPEDRSIAVISGLKHLAELEGYALEEFLEKIEAIIHGTTIADNTLIEMNGALTGLLTTEGFRDELELRRGFKEDIWDVRLEPPTPIVPRRRRLGVPERITFDGTVHTPLDEAAARKAILRLKKHGVESVAIATLFSYENAAHEKRLTELVRELMPEAHVSVSHEVLPKSPEFERISTTAVNAYVAPRVTHYLDRLVSRLRDSGYQNELLVMQASGGVMTREYLRGSPVRILASGPAGGVVGSAHVGMAKGASDLLCVDMGGTSYDMSIIRNGAAPAQPGWNWHHRYLVSVPMVQVETLGAGGGSICHVNKGVLQVGPQSAGSAPGPICYGNGGTRPTITDAILILGLLSDESDFAGGSFQLSKKGVRQAFEEQIAKPLNCSVEEAAYDCWRVVNANMTQAVRRVTAGKGTDPRDLTMLAYGGNGPVFAAIQAQELGIDRVLVPKTSPTFSAMGALTAAPSIDEERSYIVPAAAAEIEKLKEHWTMLVDRADKFFTDAGFKRDQILIRYQLNLRYPGQNWSLTVDIDSSDITKGLSFITADFCRIVIRHFEEAHEREYGHFRSGEEPEITGVRIVATAEVQKPQFSGGLNVTQVDAEPYKCRSANLGEGFCNTPIFSGPSLSPGHRIVGPAIIEETFTTIVVYPGWVAIVDDAGDYQLFNRKSKSLN